MKCANFLRARVHFIKYLHLFPKYMYSYYTPKKLDRTFLGYNSRMKYSLIVVNYLRTGSQVRSMPSLRKILRSTSESITVECT